MQSSFVFKDCLSDNIYQKRKRVSLIVSHFCDTKCSFCYIKAKGERYMSLDIAKRIVVGALESAIQEVDFNLIGAEPLNCFGMIKQLCEWTWSQNWSVPYVFHVSTNGILLDKEMKEWFSKNKKRIILRLSYSGRSVLSKHNSEVKLPDFNFFVNNWGDIPIRYAICEANVKFLSFDIVELSQLGAKVELGYTYGEAPWKRQSYETFYRQLLDISNKIKDNKIKCNIDFVSLDIGKLFLPEQEAITSYCGMYDNYRVFDYDGKRYVCPFFSPFILSKSKFLCCEEDFINGKCDRELCNECEIKCICPKCPGLSYCFSDSPFHKDVNACILLHYQVLANFSILEGTVKRQESLSPKDIENIKIIKSKKIKLLEVIKHVN